jgi:hypothetical protein
MVPDVVSKLARYALARDRSIEREPRTVTLTDDEALELLALLDPGAGGVLETLEAYYRSLWQSELPSADARERWGPGA